MNSFNYPFLAKDRFLPFWALCSAFSSVCAGAGLVQDYSRDSLPPEGAQRQPYNVLLIATDDLRCDLGCYGHPLVKSPNIDRLAKRGMLFKKAYTQQALCNPSRASMMTGMRPDSIQVWSLRAHFRDYRPNAVTLPQMFKEQGYTAKSIGKIFHNGGRTAGDALSWSVPETMHTASHYTDVAFIDGKASRAMNRDIKTECLDVPDDAYFDGRIADLAVLALKQAKEEGKPFFLGVGFWKPHLPFYVPKKYWDIYDRDKIEMPNPSSWPSGTPRIAWHNSQELLGKENEKRMKRLVLDKEKIMELRHGYYASISYMDAQVGKVLDALDAYGLAENTIIVFYSDHGYHLGEQTLWCKNSNFELDAHVPLIISVPGKEFPHGLASSSLVELLDVYPTLASLCGLVPPEGLEGTDISAILKDPQIRLKQGAVTQNPRPAYNTKKKLMPEAMGYSIRMDNIRYTEWRKWGSAELLACELYDYSDSSVELINLAENPSYERHIKEARSLLGKICPPLPMSNIKKPKY